MFALLPLLVLLLMIAMARRFVAPWRLAFSCAVTAWGVAVVVITESLSCFQQFGVAWVVTAWMLIAAVPVLYLLFTYDWPLPTWPQTSLSLPAMLLVAGIAVIVIVTGIIALVAPPNTFDSMTYHMSRVMYWLQQRSVAHFPTHNLRQDYMTPWAEYLVAQFYLLAGNDRYANCVQWLSMVGSLINVSFVARLLGAGRRGQVFAAVLCATLPMGILQATSTQTDYAAAFWLVTTLALALVLYLRLRRDMSVAVGCALGIGLLTKPTVYWFVMPFLIVGVIALARRHGKRCLPHCGIVLACALLLNLPFYARNLATFRHPLGLEVASKGTAYVTLGAADATSSDLPLDDFRFGTQETPVLVCTGAAPAQVVFTVTAEDAGDYDLFVNYASEQPAPFDVLVGAAQVLTNVGNQTTLTDHVKDACVYLIGTVSLERGENRLCLRRNAPGWPHIAALVVASPGAFDAQAQAADTITLSARDASYATMRLDTSDYGTRLIPLFISTNKSSAVVFTVTAQNKAEYGLYASYAAARPCPFDVRVNSWLALTNVGAEVTGGWTCRDVRRVFLGNIMLTFGRNEVRCESSGAAMPHLASLMIGAPVVTATNAAPRGGQTASGEDGKWRGWEVERGGSELKVKGFRFKVEGGQADLQEKLVQSVRLKAEGSLVVNSRGVNSEPQNVAGLFEAGKARNERARSAHPQLRPAGSFQLSVFRLRHASQKANHGSRISDFGSRFASRSSATLHLKPLTFDPCRAAHRSLITAYFGPASPPPSFSTPACGLRITDYGRGAPTVLASGVNTIARLLQAGPVYAFAADTRADAVPQTDAEDVAATSSLDSFAGEADLWEEDVANELAMPPLLEDVQETIALRAERFSVPAMLSSVSKDIGLHLGTSDQRSNREIQQAIEALHQVLGLDINTKPGGGRYSADRQFRVRQMIDEDTAGNPDQFMLFVIALVWMLVSKHLRHNKRLFNYGFCIVLGFVLFSVWLGWSPYNSRRHLPLFVAAMPFAGLVFEHILRRFYLLEILGMVLLVCAYPWLVYNSTRPLLGAQNIFTTPRYAQYFVKADHLRVPFRALADFTAEQQIRDIGIFCDENGYEYPLLVSLRDVWQTSANVRHIGVSNRSYTKTAALADQVNPPDVIISLAQNVTEVRSRDTDYVFLWSDGAVSLYAKQQVLDAALARGHSLRDDMRAAYARADRQMLKNGRFFEGLQNWQLWGQAKEHPNWVAVATNTGIVRVQNPGGVLVGVQQVVPVVSGCVYRLSGVGRSVGTNSSDCLFGLRVGFYLPPQKEQDIVWITEYTDWVQRERVFANTISGNAVVFIHLGYGRAATTGEVANVRLEQVQ